MPRPLRITVPNIYFHILDRGNNRQILFYAEEDFIYFLKLLKRYKKELKFKPYHLCIMPNHIHLIMEPTIEGSLPKIMMRLTLAYSSYFNKKYSGVGHVWQGRYKSSLIDKENYFIWCGLYVELNPVRTGLAASPGNWKWSSHNFYASGEGNPLIKGLIDVDPYYLQSGDNSEERQKRYLQNIEETMKERFLKEIRDKLNEGVFGSLGFVKEMKEKFKIRSSRRGRPGKKIEKKQS